MPKLEEKRYVKGLPVIREEKYGAWVWSNVNAEAIRKAHCLCLNCDRMKPGEPDHCTKAQKAYELCKEENLAFMVTRCPDWEAKAAE